MKEFELQGDISSGFRWRGKGTGKQESEEMRGGDSPERVLIPVVDSTGTKRWARIQSGGKSVRHRGPRLPSTSITIFCLPAKAKLEDNGLPHWRCSRSPIWRNSVVANFVDPYVARELHRQELRDKELRDVLNALFGKAGDWRVALCIEVRHNDYAWNKFDRALTIPR